MPKKVLPCQVVLFKVASEAEIPEEVSMHRMFWDQLRKFRPAEVLLLVPKKVSANQVAFLQGELVKRKLNQKLCHKFLSPV